jgi:hypothetical protein
MSDSPGRPRCKWEDNIKMDIREWYWGAWVGSVWLRIGTSGGLLECGYFLDQLRTRQLLRKNSTPWS